MNTIYSTVKPTPVDTAATAITATAAADAATTAATVTTRTTIDTPTIAARATTATAAVASDVVDGVRAATTSSCQHDRACTRPMTSVASGGRHYSLPPRAPPRE